MGFCGKFTLAELTSFTISTMIVFVWVMTGIIQLLSRTTDTRWLNPKFFAAQIQIPIPDNYFGFEYKKAWFFVEIMVD